MTALLQTQSLTRRFGGLTAVQDVDFTLNQGEIRGIIGPNGAGKTTFVNMVSGRLAPTAGRIFFKGRDVTRVPPYGRVRLGIVTTFQLISVFPSLTVYENVSLAVQRRLAGGPADLLRVDRRRLDLEVRDVLARLGLAEAAAEIARSLSHGHLRLLDIALALSLEPEVLILDEPTQGLAPEEITTFAALIRAIAAAATIVLIEHNMEVVLGLSTRVTVMDQGAVIAEGTPAEIEANPLVQRVYLGL